MTGGRPDNQGCQMGGRRNCNCTAGAPSAAWSSCASSFTHEAGRSQRRAKTVVPSAAESLIAKTRSGEVGLKVRKSGVQGSFDGRLLFLILGDQRLQRATGSDVWDDDVGGQCQHQAVAGQCGGACGTGHIVGEGADD